MEPHGRAVEELIDKYVKKNDKVLDLGCGTGINTIKLKRITNKIIGLDIKNFVKKEYKEHFKFILGNGTKTKFKKESFDIVVCWDVIEHLREGESLLKEINRILEKGGITLLSTPNKKRLSNRIISMFKKIKYPYYLGEDEYGVGEICHLKEYTKKEFEELAVKAGFKVIQSEGVYLGFYGFLRKGFYKVPKLFQEFSQHLFLVIGK